MRKYLLYSILSFTTLACNRGISPDRSQFLKDGEEIPSVDLQYYRSVQERPWQDSSLAVAMAISGGGSRAANFGIGVMLGLEEIQYEQQQTLLDQVDYISTVSGGGFAGGAYIAARYDHLHQKPDRPFLLKDYLDTGIKNNLTFSYTGVLLRANFNLWLYFSFVDDGDALERAIDDRVLGYKKRKAEMHARGKVPSILLGDIFVPIDRKDKEVQLPMLFTNSTVLSTMTIFPFSPDILQRYHINGYTHRMRSIKEDFIDPYSIPLSVGIKASGSFPVLISNTTLRSYHHPKRRYLHLIDGAMTDNNGYFTAMEVLKQEKTSKKILFIVDADASGNQYTFTKRERAYFSLSVYSRLASSGLQARKAVLEKEAIANGTRFGIQPFFFSFNLLIRGNNAELPKKINHQEESMRLIRLMQKDLMHISDQDMQVLYELVTNIGTKYTMKKYEQTLLFLTGRKLVHMQKEALLEALK